MAGDAQWRARRAILISGMVPGDGAGEFNRFVTGYFQFDQVGVG